MSQLRLDVCITCEQGESTDETLKDSKAWPCLGADGAGTPLHYMLPRDIHGHLTALVAMPATALRAHICGASKLLRQECIFALGCVAPGMLTVISLSLLAKLAAAVCVHICGASKLLRQECTLALGCAAQGMPTVIWLPLLLGQPPLSMCACVPGAHL